MTTKYLKIYGERNTGTNYLRQLIERNIDIRQLRGTVPRPVKWAAGSTRCGERLKDAYFRFTFGRNLGWKHALVPHPDRLRRYDLCQNGIHFATLTKNPYSWLLSLFRRPYHLHRDSDYTFTSFIRNPWPTVARECTDGEFGSPVELWNEKNRSYLELQREFPTVNLRYEDLLGNPERLIEWLRDELGLRTISDEFTNVDRSTKGDGKSFEQYQSYYLEEQWRDELSMRAIELINERLDESLLDAYGYERINP